MGVDYSAAISYGFLVKSEGIPASEEDEYHGEAAENLDIPFSRAANFWTGGDEYYVFSLEGTHTDIDFDSDPNYKKLDTADIKIDDVLELQIKLEKAGVILEDEIPGWYLTTLIS